MAAQDPDAPYGYTKDGKPRKRAINPNLPPKNIVAPYGYTKRGTPRVRPLKSGAPPKGDPRGPRNKSTTGKVKNVRADQANWRRQLQQSRIKFDDDQKEIYLRELAEHGLKGQSARVANVSAQAVLDHVEIDPDFAVKREAAMDQYRDSIVTEVRRRGREGYRRALYHKGSRIFEPLLDKDGMLVHKNQTTGEIMLVPPGTLVDVEGMEPVLVPASEQHYSDRMLELEAKRVEPAYREKQTIDLNAHVGGVLVAPADISPEDWIAREMAENATKQPPDGIDDTEETT